MCLPSPTVMMTILLKHSLMKTVCWKYDGDLQIDIRQFLVITLYFYGMLTLKPIAIIFCTFACSVNYNVSCFLVDVLVLCRLMSILFCMVDFVCMLSWWVSLLCLIRFMFVSTDVYFQDLRLLLTCDLIALFKFVLTLACISIGFLLIVYMQLKCLS